MSTVSWHLQASGSVCQCSNACVGELRVMTRELVEGENIGELRMDLGTKEIVG